MRKLATLIPLAAFGVAMLLPMSQPVNNSSVNELNLADGGRPTPPAPPKGGGDGLLLADGGRPTPPAPPKGGGDGLLLADGGRPTPPAPPQG